MRGGKLGAVCARTPWSILEVVVLSATAVGAAVPVTLCPELPGPKALDLESLEVEEASSESASFPPPAKTSSNVPPLDFTCFRSDRCFEGKGDPKAGRVFTCGEGCVGWRW